MFADALRGAAARARARLQAEIATLPQSEVSAAMRYAVRGGKGVRAFLAIEGARLHGVAPDAAAFAAAAVEAIHAYSLVHDDLPCMDDDDLRRGQPTVHVAWNEATAVLAGDALQALAFQILAEEEDVDPDLRLALAAGLARAAGAAGMVLGQAQDMAAGAAAEPLGLDEITALQAGKTGALIRWSAEAGAILGRADAAPLRDFAAALGLAFQIADDILDVEGDPGKAGKALPARGNLAGGRRAAGRDDLSRGLGRPAGHLGAGLGVVELTVALHAVFDTPRDRLIWDVGHQCYPHKILTGRRDRIRTLRRRTGPPASPSARKPLRPFGAAHSSTSISAALGFAWRATWGRARPPLGDAIAVIGDGAMSAGMAYEAMNNAGHLGTSGCSSSSTTTRCRSRRRSARCRPIFRGSYAGAPFQDLKAGQGRGQLLPEPLARGRAAGQGLLKHITVGGTLFEELGFSYVGPIDGHDLEQLLPVLRTVPRLRAEGPVLIHVLTRKGKGYPPAEAPADGKATPRQVRRGDRRAGQGAPRTRPPIPRSSPRPDREAERDDRIVAVTAAMPDGTGLKVRRALSPALLRRRHRRAARRDLCAGLAAGGLKPFCAIYSTFLQRGYDQVVHDVAIQRLPVRFAIDRAGLVGQDGATHAGAFDVAFLACLPGFVVMAAADEAELVHMVATAARHEGPIAFRFPRGEGVGVEMPERGSRSRSGGAGSWPRARAWRSCRSARGWPRC
jgi:1-deoxy-D-xylulose-5-phosphate synthase